MLHNSMELCKLHVKLDTIQNLDSSACAGVLTATAVSLFSTLSLLMMWNLLNEESAKEKCFSVCVKWCLRTE